MSYINSTRTVVNGVGTDIALAGAGNLFTLSGSLGGAKTLTLSDGFINNGAPEENLIIPVLFANGHNDLGPSLHLEITVTGVTNPIAVVSNQNGTLAPIPHHEMVEDGSTVYKVVGAQTILNMYYTSDYDGNQTPAFVIVGNPLVLSSADYSIYANGQKNYTLHILRDITLATDEAGRVNLPSSVPIEARNIVITSKTNLYSCSSCYINYNSNGWTTDVMVSGGGTMSMGVNLAITVDICFYVC